MPKQEKLSLKKAQQEGLLERFIKQFGKLTGDKKRLEKTIKSMSASSSEKSPKAPAASRRGSSAR